MARVMLREYEIPCEEEIIRSFPPSPEYFDINPLGQVPALVDGANRFFPTSVVLSYIVSKVNQSDASKSDIARNLCREECGEHDEQLLMVLLAMGDMMVAV